MNVLSQLTVEQLFFYPVAFLTLLGALGVILARNPLHSALSLVCSFFFLAALYILLAGHFVAILQVILYAGAIMVLFLFVIMLLALDDADLDSKRPTYLKVIGGLFAVGIMGAALKAFGLGKSVGNSIVVWLEMPAKALPKDFGTAAAVGRALFIDELLAFEMVSALLLVAIVGAVVVAKGRL